MVVTSNAMRAIELAQMKARLGRTDAVAYVLVGVSDDVARLPDRAGTSRRSGREGPRRDPRLVSRRAAAEAQDPRGELRGGHWVELVRLRAAFRGHSVVWATVSPAYGAHVPGERLRVVRDATRWDRLGAARPAPLRAPGAPLAERPDVVVSTGALPGFFAVLLGKRLGARTVWVDSIANVEELSLRGRSARRHADLWLTQWPELARPGGPLYAGTILE
ncbi:MAG: hypothetical protein M5U28_26230 [Sandaracinaceae bacterium]|nr:hypothetical protein [Sandaracinaceae bacterium]